ncbi:MAG: hypothetical protein BM562_06805 [Alphaproteobacteria bacterium MedPE-SWcel]|nr:MAG: hypothetical protein BM562_06805 [Alphaproteobacteria bacterium MedPE-SWcel]
MRRAFISKDCCASAVCFAVGLSFHEHPDAAFQLVNISLLPGYDFVQLVNGAVQIGDLFFEMLHGDELLLEKA